MIVHVLHTIAYGGGETIVINWLRGLDTRRFDVHLVCFANPGATEAPFVEAAQRAGVHVRLIRWSRRKPVWRAARELARLLRAVNADIVHTYNIYANLVGVLAAWMVGVKTISTVFVWSDFGWKRNILQHVDRWVLQQFDLVTAQCEQTRRDTVARGLPAARTKVLISGFPSTTAIPQFEERRAVRASMGISDGEIVLANVARLYPEKAQDVLLHSFAAMRRAHQNLRLWIFGTGPLETPLKMLCRRLELENFVRFVGFHESISTRLAYLDIQVHPSHAEGVPLALCEGLAAGIPVVASRVGGIPEILDDGRAGVLLPPAGAPGFIDAFQEAISRLVTDERERRRIGAAGREFLRTQYSVEVAVGELERTYQQLVQPCASASS